MIQDNGQNNDNKSAVKGLREGRYSTVFLPRGSRDREIKSTG